MTICNNIEFGSNKWNEKFYQYRFLMGILFSTDIPNIEFHKIEKKYIINDDRIGAIVQVKRLDRILRVAIDFKCGYATWDQVIDLTYNIGNDCDFLIAVHGDDASYDDADTEWDENFLAERLADVLLAYGVNIKLVTAKVQSDDQGKIKFNFSHDTDFICISEKFKTKLPSKRIFEETQFNLFFWGGDMEGDNYCRISDVSAWALERGSTFIMGCFSAKTELDVCGTWSDRGFFLNAAPDSEEGIRQLEWIWKNKRDELRKMYENCNRRMYYKKGRPSKLLIRLLDKPFKEVMHYDFEEKYDLGHYIHDQERNFGIFLEDLIADMPPMQMAVNS